MNSLNNNSAILKQKMKGSPKAEVAKKIDEGQTALG